jgi:hypothetical protein
MARRRRGHARPAGDVKMVDHYYRQQAVGRSGSSVSSAAEMGTGPTLNLRRTGWWP